MNRLNAILGLLMAVLAFAGSASAAYVGIVYANDHQVSSLAFGNSYAEYAAQGYQTAYAYPSYYIPSGAAYSSPYDAYPYNGPSVSLLAPSYAGYGTATWGRTTYSQPASNCSGLSLIDPPVDPPAYVPRGSAGEAEIVLRNDSGTSFTINNIHTQDTLNARAPYARPGSSIVRNNSSTTVRVPVSAAFNANEGRAVIDVEVHGQDIYGQPCTVRGKVNAIITGDGSFGNYDHRTIVHPNGVRGLDFGSSYSTTRDIAKDFDP